jgi:trk system potassium uptake protein TrkH
MKRRDLSIVVGLVADILYAYGFFLVVPALIALFVAEHAQAVTFAVGAIALVPCSWVLRTKNPTVDVRVRHAAMALAVSWISLSLLSSVPFIVNGLPWIDALFESFSAWTDTGFTMIPRPQDLPVSLGLFRILSQWASGIGIVILMLFLHGPSPKAARSLFEAEGRFEDFHTNIWQVGRTMVLIYVGYTMAGFVLFVLLGVPPFHALTHAVTSLSTGGFSTNSVGVGLYGAAPSVVAMALMLCGGISFSSHQALLSGNVKKFVRNPEIRALFWITAGATGLLVLEQAVVRGQVVDRLLETLFYVVSAISTCGAGTTLALADLPDMSVFTLVFLMITGAVYGSTTGGLKLWRVMIVGKVIKRESKRPFYPKGTVMPIRMGNNVITQEIALQVMAYSLLYLAFALGGSLVFMLFGYRSLHALFTVFSAQGNIGLNAMPDAIYYAMPPALKLQLVFHMLIGRMEIFPLFYLVRVVRSSVLGIER